MPFDANPAEEVTADRLTSWAIKARPGSALTYFAGDLATERWQRNEVDALASAAWNLANGGLLNLLQRRLGPGRFAYIASTRQREP